MSSLGAARAGGARGRASARARARASEASESMPRGRRGARRTRARANGAARALTLAVVGALALARAVDALPQCSVSSASMAAVTARADDGAKATTLEIAGRGGDPYDATTLDATKKRCFDDYVFESASDATRRWVLMSWPATSALTNATSFANATFDVDGSARATLRPDVEGKYSAAIGGYERLLRESDARGGGFVDLRDVDEYRCGGGVHRVRRVLCVLVRSKS